jgi:hypothetical protein
MADQDAINEARALMDKCLTESEDEDEAIKRFSEAVEDRPDLIKAASDDLGVTEDLIRQMIFHRVENDDTTPPGSDTRN